MRILLELRGGPKSARELGEALHLSRPVTYRLLRTLQMLGFVERDQAQGYRLGLILWQLGMSALRHPGLRSATRRQLEQLAEQYGETVLLAIYDVGTAIYIGKGEGSNPIRSYAELGGSAPAYCTATGKILLAAQPAAEQDNVLSGPLERFTPHTIVDPDVLRRELDEVRLRGEAHNWGELRDGVGGLAVPIRAHGETIAAMSFSGPVERIQAASKELLAALREAAEQVEI